MDAQVLMLVGGGVVALLAFGGDILKFVKSAFKGNSADSPGDFRRGIDGLEILVDELKKAGASDADIATWRREAIEALLKAAK